MPNPFGARKASQPRRSRAKALALLTLSTVGVQFGCTREFYREWANQDASEAVFEKSRDPRWRLDLFSIDPPALSRYADPYDPDVPAAPPDDYASQSLSPVPQWPANRLITPTEGTGYLDMLETWRQEERPAQAPANARGGPNPAPAPAAAPASGSSAPANPAPPPLPPPSLPSPFRGEENSRPGPAGMSPKPEPGTPAPNRPEPKVELLEARASKRDPQIQLAAFQQTGIPMPIPPETAAPPRSRTRPGQATPLPPPIGMDPAPSDRDLSVPTNPRPDLSPDQYRASEALGSELAGILVPGAIDFNEAEAAGLPTDSKPYVISAENAFTLALVNSRIYQFRLENVYLLSLSVTLQRFAFAPQFYAGMSPLTNVAQKGSGVATPAIGNGSPVSPGGSLGGGLFPSVSPPISTLNQFFYTTRATGLQTSNLNLSTVAGVGKVFNSGGQLLAGFANQVVFNFLGKNSIQPNVQSSLPLTFVQPFLRGGGRAVTLEPLTQAERDLLYEIRNFAKFRQEFVIVTLLGGSIQNFGSGLANQGYSLGGNSDPVVGYLNILEDVQIVENTRKNLAAFEQLYKVYKELIQGESSGLSQLQLDQVDSQRQSARQTLVTARTTYRSDLDAFKIQLGLPPDVPLIPDRTLTRRFKEVYDRIDEWQSNRNRDMADLPTFAARLPTLEDVVIDGRSVLSIYPPAKLSHDNEDKLEELLQTAERIALEHRLDLMNARAELYDSWRQIRVTANALYGVFNVALTNQILTPPTASNPFGFVSQAKQFSLVLNAELPLVRLVERNNFRTALINYQRQRRALQNQEDFIKYQVRQDIRSLHAQYLTYEIAKQNFVLTIRQKDQGFENIIAPPAAAAAGAQSSQAAIQTTNLLQFQNQLLQLENSLITTWFQYETQRLTLYRDLGTLPYDEWEAFRELFPTGSSDSDVALRNPPPPRVETGEPRQTVRR